MTRILAWLATTKFGRWAIGLSALTAFFFASWYAAKLKGKREQASVDSARDAQARADAAVAARETYTDAADAASRVRAEAAARPRPDPAKRDDFETDF